MSEETTHWEDCHLVHPECASQQIRKLSQDLYAYRLAYERLRDWAEGECICPCCQEKETCLDGCTFEEDAPSDAEVMHGWRETLKSAREVLGDA
jgi:hypothetical protein